VDGGEIIIHLHPNGKVFAVTSSVLPDTMDTETAVDGVASLQAAVTKDDGLKHYTSSIKVEVAPTLCYLILNDEGFLVYRSLVSYVDHLEHNITKKTHLYVDAKNGHLILNNPIFMTALNRQVYTANQKTSLPGTLMRKEGQAAVNDQAVNAAYDNSGVCYNFYKTTFGRDSIDGKGAKLSSTVHYSSNYNNAFWDGTQMVYGDGDGKSFSDFAADLSVVCHELTHAVTSYSANLRYQGESGALNEAMSDIFGAASTVFKGGLNQNTWLIGHDCYLAGTALRYMNNPLLDKVSYDWYPTRYKGTSDNGGVHWNSGIANLAFVLMVQGGVHPQQKSKNWVEEIGIAKAQQIFYSSLTQYMTASTTFAQARAATETAAKALYSTTEVSTVSNGWIAVGVN
jgi:Zn-dependent metalloprotease